VISRFLRDVAILFATIDPIGTVLVFVAITRGHGARDRRRIALRGVLVGGAILLAFMVLGEVVLNAMHVGLRSFQIAGAMFLFFFGAQLTFGQGAHAGASPEPGHDIAVFPLALPAIASPGALAAVVVLTNNDVYSIPMQASTAVALLLVLSVTYVLLLSATRIHRMLGNAGAAVLIRVLGLILASLAVELLLQALHGLRLGSAGTAVA
jgi:multiple antibiotic resistance protein